MELTDYEIVARYLIDICREVSKELGYSYGFTFASSQDLQIDIVHRGRIDTWFIYKNLVGYWKVRTPGVLEARIDMLDEKNIRESIKIGIEMMNEYYKI